MQTANLFKGNSMRRLFVSCCLLLAAFAARADIVDIDSAELAKLAAAGVPVIDIRTRPEWEETGIVPGSRLLTFFDERGRANPAAWLERAKEIARPGEPLVVICRSGNRTKALSQFLSQQRDTRRSTTPGNGIQAWAKEGRPMVSAAPALAACRAAKTC